MELKITKGVWEIDTGYSTMLPISVEHGKIPICEVDCDYSAGGFDLLPTQEQLANAHLIASAPDMYRMLSGLLAQLKCEWPQDIEHFTGDIEKTLKKARGE